MTPGDQGPEGTVREWLALARGGSEEALGRALEAFRPLLLRVARRRMSAELLARESASDVVQEAFAVAAREFGRFGGSCDSDLRAWLAAILRNALAHAGRRHRAARRSTAREVALDGPGPAADSTTIPTRADRRERARIVVLAFAGLAEADRQVLRWREHEGRTFAEIGALLGVSDVAARKAWTRAVERLAAAHGRLRAERAPAAGGGGTPP